MAGNTATIALRFVVDENGAVRVLGNVAAASRQAGDAAKKAGDVGKSGIDRLAKAFDDLGIKSGRDLGDMRAKAMDAFNAIAKSGKASAEEIIRAEKAKNDIIRRLNAESARSSDSLFGSFVKAGLATDLISASVRKLKQLMVDTFEKGFLAVETYNQSVASLAAMAMTFTERGEGMTQADQWERALRYSSAMVPVLENLAAKTLLSGEETTALANAFARSGVFLDGNNQKQIESFTRISNALPLMTQGQEIMRQINTEIRALMQGTNESTSMLLTTLKSIDPQIESHLDLWRSEGTALENIGDLLSGFGPATQLLENQWEAVKSTIETTSKQIMRGGMTGAYEDIIGYTKGLNGLLEDQKDRIAGDIAIAWAIVGESIEIVYDVVKKLEFPLDKIWGLVEHISYGIGGLLTVLETIMSHKAGDGVKKLFEDIDKEIYAYDQRVRKGAGIGGRQKNATLGLNTKIDTYGPEDEKWQKEAKKAYDEAVEREEKRKIKDAADLLALNEAVAESQQKLNSDLMADRMEGELKLAQLRMKNEQDYKNWKFDNDRASYKKMEAENKQLIADQMAGLEARWARESKEQKDFTDRNLEAVRQHEEEVKQFWNTAKENIQTGLANMFQAVFTRAANDLKQIFGGAAGSMSNVFSQQLSAQIMTGFSPNGKFDWSGMAMSAGAGAIMGTLGNDLANYGAESAIEKAINANVNALKENSERLRELAAGDAISPFAKDIDTAAGLFKELKKNINDRSWSEVAAGKGMGQYREGMAAYQTSMESIFSLITKDIDNYYQEILGVKTAHQTGIDAATRRFDEFRDGIRRLSEETGADFDFILEEWNAAEKEVLRVLNIRDAMERQGVLSGNDYSIGVTAGSISPLKQATDGVNRSFFEQRARLVDLGATVQDLTRLEKQRIETLRLTAQAYHAEAVASAQAGYSTAAQGELQRAQAAQAALEQRAADAKSAYTAALQERAAAEKAMIDAQAAGVQAQAKAVGDLADQSARMVETFRELADKIRDYRSGLLTSDAMMDPALQYKMASRQFDAAMRDMYSGNAGAKAAAIEKLPQLSDKLLELSRATGGAYQSDMARVLTALNTAEGMAGTGRSTAELQLDSLLAQQATLETQAQTMSEQVGVYQRMLDGMERDETDTRSFEEIQQAYWDSQAALENSTFQTEIDYWQNEINRMDLLINGSTSIDQATRYYGEALLAAIRAGADTDGSLAAQANAMGVSPAETAFWDAMGDAVRAGVQSGDITDFQRAGASFAGGGTISGPASGYTIPTTFHGTEHVVTEDRMGDVCAELSALRAKLDEILRVTLDIGINGRKSYKIIDGCTQGGTAIRTQAA